MAIDWNDNKLTDEIKSSLKQGSKVKFKWHGNSSLEYIGRIEVDELSRLYFVNEHSYYGNILIQEGMRFYNSLESFHHFTMFEVLSA